MKYIYQASWAQKEYVFLIFFFFFIDFNWLSKLIISKIPSKQVEQKFSSS